MVGGNGAVGREKSSRTNRMNSVSSCPNDVGDEEVCGWGGVQIKDNKTIIRSVD